MSHFIAEIAKSEDIDLWMELLESVRETFPGLETEESIDGYREAVMKNIDRGTAICVKVEKKIVGALLFSLNQKSLSWMAVHPEHRKKGIGTVLIEKMLEDYPERADISVTTFREEDEKGLAARGLYKKFGFEEGDLVEEFNYPNQVFILKRGN